MHRIFLGWDHPALPAACDRLLDHYRSGADCRMQDAYVVLPGARAGRRLKEILEERSRWSGLRLVPPRVITIGHLPEHLYSGSVRIAPPEVSRLCWIHALKTVDREELARVFSRRPADDSHAEWAGLAAEVSRLHGEVASGGHHFEGVARVFTTSDPWDDHARWTVLAEVQRRYQECLDRVGMADRDLLRIRMLDRADPGVDADIWLVGIAECPTVTRRFLALHQDRVRVLVHAPDVLEDHFDDMGCVIPDVWQDAVLPLADGDMVFADGPGEQAEVVARVLADAGPEQSPDDFVVGVPWAGIIPWVEERLSTGGVATRDAGGIPALKTGPFRLLAAVSDAMAGDRWEFLAALARHPDVVEWLRSQGHEPEELLACADRWYVAHLPERVPDSGALPGSGSSDGVGVSTLVSVLRDSLMGPLRSVDSPTLRGWVEPVLMVLASVYAGRGLRADRPAHRVVIRALEQLGRGIGDFRAIPDALDMECGVSTAIRMYVEHAGGAAIPNPQDHAAVELLGWLEMHLDDAPITVVTGVNEPWLPESVTADPFLPNALRSRLSLPDNRMRYARDAYRLSAMAQSRQRLVVVSARRDENGDPLRPSRLLFATQDGAVAGRVRRFYDATVAPDQAASGYDDPVERTAASRSRATRFELPPESEIRFSGPVTQISVTRFKRLLTDPYGDALARYRGCEPIDDHAREMDASAFGSLAHVVIQQFSQDASVVHLTDRALVQTRLDERLDVEITRLFGDGARNAKIAVRIQADQLRTRLARFAAWHVDRISGGWRVMGVEIDTQHGGVPLSMEGPPVGITARIDRIEHHPERGEWAVVDVKTGDTAADPAREHGPRDGAWTDLQLPLYRWLLPRLRDPGGALRYDVPSDAIVHLGYLRLSKDPGAQIEAWATWSDDDLRDALDTARRLVAHLRSGVVRFGDDYRVPSWADDRFRALVGQGQFEAVSEDGEDDA